MKTLTKYNRYSLALTDDEDKMLKEVKEYHKVGDKKIFMTMVTALYGQIPEPVVVEEEE